MNTVILFKTSKGYEFSPIFQGHTEETLDEYEKKVRENCKDILYSKRFSSFLDMKKYIKEQTENAP